MACQRIGSSSRYTMSMLPPFVNAGKRWTRPMDKVDGCSQCVYEAAERCKKPNTALDRKIQSNRKWKLEISYGKFCECLSCDPQCTGRRILINSDDCLCKKSEEARFRSCVHRLCGQPYWSCKTQSWRGRSRSPPSPPPGMKLIQGQSKRSHVPEKHVEKSEPQKQKRGQPVAATPQSINQRRMPSSSSIASYCKCPAQMDWESVRALLSPKVLQLERTIPEVRWALEDLNTTIRLPEHNNLAGHCKNVIEALPRHFRFKVGITAFLRERFYEARYAYSMPGVHKTDGVVYEFFILILVHHERQTISWVEHFLINLFAVEGCQGIPKERCANRLIIVDDHWKCESDEEKSEAAGPHFVYFACGERCRIVPR